MKFLKKLKDEITSKYSRKIQTEEPSEEQKTEYEQAKKDLQEKEASLVEPSKSFLFRLFFRRKYKKQVKEYNDTLKEIDLAKKRVSSTGLILEQKETAIGRLQEAMQEELKIFEGMNLDYSKNASVKHKSLLDNEAYVTSCKKIREYIDEMIRIDPKLVNDVEFMTACVEFDMDLITLDKTNSPEVYQTFLKQYKENFLDEKKLIGEGYSRDDIVRTNETYAQLMQELTNPAPVSDGKFKIPHRFIFERIRTACSPDAEKKGIGELCEFAYSGYKKFDGILSKEDGERLLSLYEDENNYLYIHNVNYDGSKKSEEEISATIENIKKKGLLLPSEGDLAHTTINTNEDESLGLLNILNYWVECGAVVVAQVPKAEVDGKKPIIGFENAEQGTRGRLLPEYIIGSIREGKYATNDIPADQIARYDIIVPDGQKPDPAVHGKKTGEASTSQQTNS